MERDRIEKDDDDDDNGGRSGGRSRRGRNVIDILLCISLAFINVPFYWTVS